MTHATPAPIPALTILSARSISASASSRWRASRDGAQARIVPSSPRRHSQRRRGDASWTPPGRWSRLSRSPAGQGAAGDTRARARPQQLVSSRRLSPPASAPDPLSVLGAVADDVSTGSWRTGRKPPSRRLSPCRSPSVSMTGWRSSGSSRLMRGSLGHRDRGGDLSRPGPVGQRELP